MSISSQHPLKRVAWTVILAILAGGFGWSIVGEELLNAGTTVRTVLWAAFALFAGAAYWSDKPRAGPQRRTVATVVVVIGGAIVAVVLLNEPTNLYVGGAVLVIGGFSGLLVRGEP